MALAGKIGWKLSVCVLAALIAGACGSSSSGPTTGGIQPQPTGDINFGSDSSFTGPNANFGQEQIAGCFTAVDLIDQNGGILGHMAHCAVIDNKNDPADGVAAATKAVATITNLEGTLGPGGVATATEPIYQANKITMMADTGDSAFNHTTDKYFWRITPPDSAGGYALAEWALKQSYMSCAAVFSNDTTAQTSVPTLRSGYKKGGGNMVVDLSVVPDQSSYQVEAARVVAAHPQCIFTEADAQTDATFFKAFLQLNGSMVPIVGTAPTITADWATAVGKAIGTANLDKYYVGLQPYVAATGPSWQVYNTALLADKTNVTQPSNQWSADAYSITDYDGVTIMALAMLAAGSVVPIDYNSHIIDVTAPGGGKTDVISFADGKTALAAGKKIHYIGAGGAVNFNQYHNFGGDFSANGYDAGGNPTTAGTVTAAEIAKITT